MKNASDKKVVDEIKTHIERKLEDVLREGQFGFRRRKGTRDAIGMLRISERTMDRCRTVCLLHGLVEGI